MMMLMMLLGGYNVTMIIGLKNRFVGIQKKNVHTLVCALCEIVYIGAVD